MSTDQEDEDDFYVKTIAPEPHDETSPTSSITPRKRSWEQYAWDEPRDAQGSGTEEPRKQTGVDGGSRVRAAFHGKLDVHYLDHGVAYATIHQIICTKHASDKNHRLHGNLNLFYDVPRLWTNDNKRSLLRGRQPITWHREEGSLEDQFRIAHPEVDFAVMLQYSCGQYHDQIVDSMVQLEMPPLENVFKREIEGLFCILREDGPIAEPYAHGFSIVHVGFYKALDRIQKKMPQYFRQSTFRVSFPEQHIKTYDDYYRIRSKTEMVEVTVGDKLSEAECLQFRALCNVIDEFNRADYEAADLLFAKGMTSRRHSQKLFGAGDVVLDPTDGRMQAYLVQDIARSSYNVTLYCWSWEYDGVFKRHDKTFTIVLPLEIDMEVSISGMQVFPIRFCQDNSHDQLLRRGRTFWTCRTQKFVSYVLTNTAFTTTPRYMIDHAMYRRMHKQETNPELLMNNSTAPEQLDLTGEKEPPAEPFLVLLPPTIRGYGFHDKKWRPLNVDHIREVSWNSNAFDQHLVLKQQKKDLIKALISVHMSGEDSYQRDIIEGKGRGLIILLHGSPGTGKTLTAESIAEFTEKPLYRVTCGDIGTDPDTVEKYLETVLLIGTVWKCVVLLDEADVYLEERTPTDMLRNALVSSFLRVLEYFDGILILTSNRIGAFDEAFKSRVQLALHYPPLDEPGRWEIWNMFLKAMHREDVPMDYAGIRAKLETLARNKLNGRQIRNTVNTGRQLARYKKEELTYTHFNQAIEVLNEFESYVQSGVGHTDDEFAQATGKRKNFP